jgi:hypothetical protein
VRDALVVWTEIDEEVKNLVNVIPHREYRDGFLFNDLKDYPEKEEEGSTTLESAGPLFDRNYFWAFTDQFIEYEGQKYYQITAKEVIEIWTELKYISADALWKIVIKDILDAEWKPVSKVTCNTGAVYMLTDKELTGREILYK